MNNQFISTGNNPQLEGLPDDELWIVDDDGAINPEGETWKVLIVDDEMDVHTATQLALEDFRWQGKALTLLSAYSGEEAIRLIANHPDTAFILLDVVMETPDAGLKVVEYVRNVLKNLQVRIILRTGQPGEAPEESIIVDYDINDYKTKLELTQQKLITMTITALRAYQDILALTQSREQLAQLNHQLEALNQNLDEQVVQRTEELTVKNQQLQQEIERRRQSEAQLQQSLEREQAMAHILDKMRKCLQIDSILEIISEQIQLIIPCDRVAVYQFSPDWGGCFVCEAVTEGFESFVNQGEGAKSWIDECLQQTQGGRFSQGEPLVVDDVNAENYSPCYHEALKQYQIQAYAIAPIFTSDQLWGLLAVYHHTQTYHWQPEDIRLLVQIANSMGIALQQAELFSQIKEQSIQLQRAKDIADAANRAKSEFLANMSHDIRTPMNAILGFCDLLQELVTEERQRTYVKAISSAGKTLLVLINDILDLSKIEAGKLTLNPEPVNLQRVLTEIQQFFNQEVTAKGITILLEIDPNVPQGIVIDEVRLRQILFNLVSNGIKFTQQGYVKIEVKAEPIEPCLSPISDAQSSRTHLEIRIVDTGIGIKPEAQQTIFKPFVQSQGQSYRQYGGTGLGLAITHKLTQLLGGTIELTSELGKGSSFRLILPDVETTVVKTLSLETTNIDDDLDQFVPAKILVIDDVQSNLDLIQSYFAKTQHHLLLAHSGEEGIDLAQNHHPNLILLDLRMPGMSGEEVAYSLKQNESTKEITIVVVTAFAYPVEQERLNVWCQGFLRKPVSRSQLVDAFQRILPKKETFDPEDRDQSNDISAEKNLRCSLPRIPELLRCLEQEKNTVWEEIQRKMKRRDIHRLTERLQGLAVEYECSELLKYAKTLDAQLKAFDWNQLPETIEQFPDVIKQLSQQ